MNSSPLVETNNRWPVLSLMDQQHHLSLAANSGGLKRPHKRGIREIRKRFPWFLTSLYMQMENCAGECLYMSLSYIRREIMGEVRVFWGSHWSETLKNQDCACLIFHL